MKVLYNENNNDLWCIECKKIIPIGITYIVVEEKYLDEKIIKEYHGECIPEMEDEE